MVSVDEMVVLYPCKFPEFDAFVVAVGDNILIYRKYIIKYVQLFVILWTAGIPIHHQLLEIAQFHVHQVGDAIQPSHPLSSPSPAFNLAQHEGLFQCVSSSHQVAKVLEFQLQYQSFQ